MSADGLTRRDVLRLGAGLGVLALVPGCGAEAEPFDEGTCDPAPADGGVAAADPSKAAENGAIFDLGVQAGSATSTSVVVWARVSEAGAKTAKVWREASGSTLLVKSIPLVPAEGFVRTTVEGLAPNTVYRYAFFDDATGGRSVVGRVRTAYAGDCQRALTVAATVCTKTANAPFRALEALAKEEFDLLLHLGDFSYNDGALTREEYRAKWGATLGDVGYRALLPRASLLATWDDHEFVDNSTLYSTGMTEERKATARAAYFEHVAMEPAADGRLWKSFKWGRTAEFFVLDCRTERRPETRTSAHPIYVSDEQLAWLKDGLEKSDATFKVVLNSVPILGFSDAGWNLAENDRWQGYEAQRQELLGHITAKAIRNVWFLSGDLHVAVAARIEREGPAAAYWEILVGPGGNNSNPLWPVYLNGSETDREAIAPSDQFAYFYGDYATTTLTFDPATDSVRVRFLDVTGKVLFDQALRQAAPAPV